MEDPDELLVPSCDGFFIAFLAEESRNCTPITLLHGLLLDFGHSSGVGTWVKEALSTSVTDPTHVVSCPIAPRTDGFGSCNCLPVNPRWRA